MPGTMLGSFTYYIALSACTNCSLKIMQDFPGGTVVKNPPAKAGDTGSSPGLGGSTCRAATKPVSHNY